MNCLFSEPRREKLRLVGSKVQKGGIVFYLSCPLLSPSPDSVASSLSLLSRGTAPPLPLPFLSTAARLQHGEVQLVVFLKQDFIALNQTSFSKDSFTNDAVKNICFCKFKRIQMNLF